MNFCYYVLVWSHRWMSLISFWSSDSVTLLLVTHFRRCVLQYFNITKKDGINVESWRVRWWSGDGWRTSATILPQIRSLSVCAENTSSYIHKTNTTWHYFSFFTKNGINVESWHRRGRKDGDLVTVVHLLPQSFHKSALWAFAQKILIQGEIQQRAGTKEDSNIQIALWFVKCSAHFFFIMD